MGNYIHIGIFGASNSGNDLIVQLQEQSAHFHVCGFYEPHDAHAHHLEQQFSLSRFSDQETLLALCDAIVIQQHFADGLALAFQATRNGCHIYFSDLYTISVKDINRLLSLSLEAGTVIHGSNNRFFNKAFQAAKPLVERPKFIEVTQAIPYLGQAFNQSIILDQVIYDLALVLDLANSPVRTVNATGVQLVSEHTDTTAIRIAFENGCIAHITASRVSPESTHTIVAHQQTGIVTIDFSRQNAQFSEPNETLKLALLGVPPSTENEKGLITKTIALNFRTPVNQITHFHAAISQHQIVTNAIENAAMCLKLAHQLVEKVKIKWFS
jgi:predicted dehydrogenase